VSTVRDELTQWVAAARGALEWHVEAGEAALPVPDDFQLPALGTSDERPRSQRPTQPEAPRAQARGFAPRLDPSMGATPNGGPPPNMGQPANMGPPPPADRAPAAFQPSPTSSAQPEPSSVVAPSTPAAPIAADGDDAQAALRLHQLATQLTDCARCGLCEERTELVFGAGNPNARVLFVADAPGIADDQLGLPFAGEDGGLLGKMIRAMGLNRSKVYLTTLVKCRPNQSGDPDAQSLSTCRTFFDQQLDAIRPEIIVTLGTGAARQLAGSDDTLPVIRGQALEYRGIPVKATFHPLAILKSRQDRDRIRRAVWDDLKAVMRKLGPPGS
jgi:DNA polymerase